MKKNSKTSNFSKVHNSLKKNKEWKKILESWITIISTTAKYWGDDDLPWWHHERTSISFLAGAAWFTGHRAVEEYAVNKSWKNQRYTGRGDVFFEIGKRNKHEFICEAKKTWGAFSRPSADTAKRLESRLKVPCDEVSDLNYDSADRLGLLFVAPWVHKSHSELWDHRKEELKKAIEEVKPDAYAWVFREQPAPPECSKGRLYPGEALLIKYVDK